MNIRGQPFRRWLGVVLFLAGFGLTILLAFIAGSQKPASQATDAVIVILIGLMQAGAAFTFSGIGRADPSHAQRSTARLIWLARRADVAGERAQEAFESQRNPSVLRSGMGILATDLSWIQDGLIEAIEDWRVFHPEAVREAEVEQNDDGR